MDSGKDFGDGSNDVEINLSSLESFSFCLGRFRDAAKISFDAVLLMCGGGRSNTNMMLGSDSMANDTVLQPFEKGADIAM